MYQSFITYNVNHNRLEIIASLGFNKENGFFNDYTIVDDKQENGFEHRKEAEIINNDYLCKIINCYKEDFTKLAKEGLHCQLYSYMKMKTTTRFAYIVPAHLMLEDKLLIASAFFDRFREAVSLKNHSGTNGAGVIDIGEIGGENRDDVMDYYKQEMCFKYRKNPGDFNDYYSKMISFFNEEHYEFITASVYKQIYSYMEEIITDIMDRFMPTRYAIEGMAFFTHSFLDVSKLVAMYKKHYAFTGGSVFLSETGGNGGNGGIGGIGGIGGENGGFDGNGDNRKKGCLYQPQSNCDDELARDTVLTEKLSRLCDYLEKHPNFLKETTEPFNTDDVDTVSLQVNKIIGEVRKKRKALKMTQEDLSKLTNIPVITISRMESMYVDTTKYDNCIAEANGNCKKEEGEKRQKGNPKLSVLLTCMNALGLSLEVKNIS